MQFARTINAEADEKVALLEEGAPILVDQDTVGLKGVLHRLAKPAVLLDEFDGTPKEVELHERGLAALPRHDHFGCAVRLKQLTDIGLERGLGHPVLVVRIERFFG